MSNQYWLCAGGRRHKQGSPFWEVMKLEIWSGVRLDREWQVAEVDLYKAPEVNTLITDVQSKELKMFNRFAGVTEDRS